MKTTSVVFLATLMGSIAWPQQTPTDGHKIGGVTVQGSIRSRVEAWDWFQAGSGENKYAYSGNLLRFSFSKSADQWDWQVEFAAPFLLGLPDAAVAPGVQGQLGLGASYFVANQSQNAAMMISFFTEALS